MIIIKCGTEIIRKVIKIKWLYEVYVQVQGGISELFSTCSSKIRKIRAIYYTCIKMVHAWV